MSTIGTSECKTQLKIPEYLRISSLLSLCKGRHTPLISLFRLILEEFGSSEPQILEGGKSKMRNLKRTLSLLLAVVMVIGMMVVGASAASSDFTDSDEITNTEAVGVMTALGVFEGTDSGAFDPSGTLTREQAAAIICRMLLGDDAESLTTNSVVFSDVATDRWSAGYIGYCAQQGILAGTGNGTFDPEGELTGLVLANTISREDAAQMAFQTLEADMVTYSGSGSTNVTTPDGTTVVITGSATEVSNNRSDDYRTVSDDRDEVQQFCEYYFPNLTKNSSGEDAFGRPSVTWRDNRTEIGTFSETPEASFTAGADMGDIYDAVGRDAYNAVSDGDADLTVVVNGDTVSSPDLDDYIVRSSTSDAEGTGRGILTEVFVDDDDNITITQIWTHVAQVDGDYDTDDGELDLATLEGAEFDADDYTLTDDDFDNLDAYADEDYVLVTVASGEIQSIQPAETVSGAVTAYTVGSSVTLDGERYYYSKSYTQGTLTKTDGTYDPLSYDLNEDYTLVLDGNGYVVYSDATDATHDYVLIARVAPIGGVNSSVEALAYFTDGTSATIDVDDDSTATFGDEDLVEVEPTGSSSYVLVNQWHEYSERSNGEYRLSDVDDGEKGTVKSSSSGDVDIITSGSTSVLVNNVDTNGDIDEDEEESIRVNNSTLFVINNDGDISTFTGVRDVADVALDANGSATVAWAKDDADDTYAAVVYVVTEDLLSVSGTSSDRVFILDYDGYETSVDSDDNTYYEYDAIVNGEITTVSANDDDIFDADGLYRNISYDSDGYVSNARLVSSTGNSFVYRSLSEATNVSYSNGVIEVGSYDVVLADDYTIFLVEDNDATEITTSRLNRDYSSITGTVYAYLNDDDEATEVYVAVGTVYDDDGESDTVTYGTVQKANTGNIYAVADALMGDGDADGIGESLVAGMSDVTVSSDDDTIVVSGTVGYTRGFTGFSSVEDDQNGYYVVLRINAPNVDGIDGYKQAKPDWGEDQWAESGLDGDFYALVVLRVTGSNSTTLNFQWTDDGETVATTTYTVDLSELELG